MQRFRLGGLLAVTLALSIAIAVPTVALATLESPAQTESSTNPNVGDESATWRWSWGNTILPDMTVTGIPTDGSTSARNQTLGFIYDVRQVDRFGAGAVVPVWETSSLSPRPEGSSISEDFDISRVNEIYGWTAYPGATQRGEGMYAISFLFYNQFRVQDPATVNVRYRGLDFTAPAPVSGLTASTAGLAVAEGTWTEARRRDFSWSRLPYDSLSGVGGFEAKLNANEPVFIHNTAPDLATEYYASFLGSTANMAQVNHYTVENLPAGVSTVSIAVVDRATNKSAPVSVLSHVDYDTPKLAITAPTSGGTVVAAPTFTVNATDAAGVARVRYFVDDVAVGVATSAPYSLKANLSRFANGSHVLKAVVEDRIGATVGAWSVPHTATQSVRFTLDKKPVKLSAFSRTPALFYPIRRDRYFDNSTIKYTLNKPATVTLTIRNSAGKTVQVLSGKKAKAGKYAFVWNGKWKSDGKAHTGKYSYQITALDAAGYKASTSKLTTTIRNYQLIKTGRNSVKVRAR